MRSYPTLPHPFVRLMLKRYIILREGNGTIAELHRVGGRTFYLMCQTPKISGVMSVCVMCVLFVSVVLCCVVLCCVVLCCVVLCCLSCVGFICLCCVCFICVCVVCCLSSACVYVCVLPVCECVYALRCVFNVCVCCGVSVFCLFLLLTYHMITRHSYELIRVDLM